MMNEANVIIHHGIKGQKWGVRRFQNKDGSRTSAGLAHDRKLYAEQNDSDSTDSSGSSKRKGLSDGQKEALKTAGKVALAAAAVAGTAYLYSQHKDEIDGLIRQTSAQLTNKLPTEIEASGKSFVQKAFDDASASIAKKAERREAVQNAVNKATGAVIGAKDSAISAASGAVKKVASAAKETAKNTAQSAKSAASKAGKAVQTSTNDAVKNARKNIRTVSKSASQNLSEVAKNANDQLTNYMVTRAMDSAANRRLQNKQEKHRHKEEMARIKQGR